MGVFDKYEIRTILYMLFFVVWGVITIGLIPLMIGLGPTGGFEVSQILQKFMFYIGPGAIFLIGIVALTISSFIIFRGESEKDINGVILHNPEKGVFSFLSKYLTLTNTIFIFLILFSILGLFSTTTQTFFHNLPVIEQQFTKTADLIFAVYPASPAESFGLIFVVLLTLFLLGLYYKRKNIPKNTYLLVAFPLVLLVSGFYGGILHTLRYVNQELSMLVTIGFWMFSGALILLFGSIIPTLLLHDTNNFFFKVSKLFPSDKAVAIVIGVLAILIIIFIFKLLLKRKKNGKEKIIT